MKFASKQKTLDLLKKPEGWAQVTRQNPLEPMLSSS